MANPFFDQPILNTPYEMPSQHWELDDNGQPTQEIGQGRRPADFITPIPKPRKGQKGTPSTTETIKQSQLDIFGLNHLSDDGQDYDPTSRIGQVRIAVDNWRRLPQSQWQVTPETARLLHYWRTHPFSSIKPFFCQVEAIETAIWLTEVASKSPIGRRLTNYLKDANALANPELERTAFKLATGTGKTTVMAMIIAWQTINAVRHPQSNKFTKGFLVVTPGITIKDRLRVLKPNDPDSYFKTRELVPQEFMPDIERARVVITNYHAFKPREKVAISRGGRALLKGQNGDDFQSVESEGEMVKRVMPDLMGVKNIMVINDEAHHCYRERPSEEDDAPLQGDEKDEAGKQNEAARLWLNGLVAVKSKIRINTVLDLSATPFFLKGSGWPEGTLFPWTMSDFSLMDAIECGIVKLPRVPISDNIPGNDMPMYRNLWDYIGPQMPKKGRRKDVVLDPQKLPMQLQTALEALYGHYKNTFETWKSSGIRVPPCMIIVCNNTATSKLLYDYVSGFTQENKDGTGTPFPGRLELFRNFDEHGNKLARPNTILIDSLQLESGDALDTNFRKMAADEIERFRRDLRERGDLAAAENITDQDLLREVMNTTGKEGRLGEQIRCVVSVSMLTEGWDANNVAYIMGVRAFGTQLLCEQVVGRALRRQSYDPDDETGLLEVEYADVLGIPFDFTATPVVVGPREPRQNIHVRAISPERDHLEVRFPRVLGYRIALPEEELRADFNDDATLVLTPDIVGATEIEQKGIIGETAALTLEHLKDQRRSTLVMSLATHMLMEKWRDSSGAPKMHLYPGLKRITNQWLSQHLVCNGGTYPAQLMNKALADMATERITAAITATMKGTNTIRAWIDPYNPEGSTRHVNFTTARKDTHWETDPNMSHVNWAVCDSTWETRFCQVVEKHPRVKAYVKNHSMGFEVPYRHGSENRKYIPDFILLVDTGTSDLFHLIVEIKGYRGEDAKDKKITMDTYWVPGVNNVGTYGKWGFAEFTNVLTLADDLEDRVKEELDQSIERLTRVLPK